MATKQKTYVIYVQNNLFPDIIYTRKKIIGAYERALIEFNSLHVNHVYSKKLVTEEQFHALTHKDVRR